MPPKISKVKRQGGPRDEARSARNFSHSKAKKKGKLKGRLSAGSHIQTKNHSYVIQDVIGAGGFGEVYKVMADEDEKKLFAIKIEFSDTGRGQDRLKLEMNIFNEVAEAKESKKIHFLELFDRGHTDRFRFVVITLVGQSLEGLRKEVLRTDYSLPTVLQIALQTLQSIWDLHDRGYLHRDIKPHNFAIGLGPTESTVYMLDFGICRRYMDINNRMIKIPRIAVKFIGTLTFASRRAHREEDQGRADDLEQWLYMIYDLFCKENLGWRHMRDQHKIYTMKLDFFSSPLLSSSVPSDFIRITHYIGGLKYSDEPDYPFIRKIINMTADSKKIDLKTTPLDWVTPAEEKKEEQSEMENKSTMSVMPQKEGASKEKKGSKGSKDESRTKDSSDPEGDKNTQSKGSPCEKVDIKRRQRGSRPS